MGIGKISHYVDGLLNGYTESVGTEYEQPQSWDEMLLNTGKWGTGLTKYDRDAEPVIELYDYQNYP